MQDFSVLRFSTVTLPQGEQRICILLERQGKQELTCKSIDNSDSITWNKGNRPPIEIVNYLQTKGFDFSLELLGQDYKKKWN